MATYIANEKARGNPFTEIPSDTDKNPFRLVWEDICSVFQLCKLLILIVTPHEPCPSGPLDELYINRPNVQALFLHTLLVISQFFSIVALPVTLAASLIFPGIVHFVYFTLFWLVTHVILRLLNGGPTAQCLVGIPSKQRPVNDESELWFFINGIATGKTWLQSNLDLLANTFRREIVGIHNPTKGIIFDLIECLIQRDLDYKTADIRQGRAQLRAALNAAATEKVVLILHSQGGIEGASIINWLLADLSHDKMRKLEVFTFGNAARQFSNPPLSENRTQPMDQRTYGERVFKHIEHYANSEDFVANIDVLQFTTTAAQYSDESFFSGQVFKRHGSGHLLNLHYLDTMFPVEDGEVREHNTFMDTKVAVPDPNFPHGIMHKPIAEISRLWAYRNGRSPAEE